MITNKGLRNHQFYDPASGGGGIVSELLAGEAFDVTANNAPFAIFPKVKKKLVIGPTNNILSTDKGNITLLNGTHLYPYTALKTDMETKLNALGATVFAAEIEEKNTKISADVVFTIDKLVANSAALTLGYNALDTSVASAFFRADAVRQFTNGIYIFKTNTDDDIDPPILASDESTQVAANWRSRSYSGYITSDAVEGDEVEISTSGEIEDFTGLTLAADHFTNGTAGEISETSIANSLEAGKAASTTKLVLDPTDKGFEFQIEPDTDFKANTEDGISGWEDLPEIPSFLSGQDAALTGAGFEGNNVVSVQIGTGSLGYGKIGYSTNKGKSWKVANLELPTGHSLNETTLQTMNTSAWGDTNDFYGNSPDVAVWGNNVFIGYIFWDNGTRRIKGLYGQIDSNGDLTLRLSNEFLGSPYATLISNSGSGIHRMGIRVSQRNGIVYISHNVNDNAHCMLLKSADAGATFEPENFVKNVATSINTNANGPNDFQPQRMAIVDVPGQSVTPTELVANGDFSSGDLTGWNDDSSGSGTATVNGSNQLVITNPSSGNFGRVNQQLTTVAGKTYKLTYDVVQTSAEGSVAIRDTSAVGTVIESTSRPYEGSRQIVFTALSAVSYIIFGVADASSDDIIYDNISVQEVLQNRACISVVSTPTGDNAARLFYTDDQDLTANWAAEIDFAQDISGNPFHLLVGSYLHSDNKWYLHAVGGHNTADGSGGTGRVGDTDKSQLIEIDLTQNIPTVLSGLVDWEPNDSSQIALANGSGLTSNNNGMYFFKDTTNIIATNDGVFATVSLDSGEGYTCRITDMSDITNTTEIVRNENYLDFAGSVSLVTEQHFAKINTTFQLIYKRHQGSYGNGDELGGIRAKEITIDDTAKAELIVNGTFDTDIDDWTLLVGVAVWNAGRLRLNSANQVEQVIPTVIGKQYILKLDQFQISAPSFGFIDIRDAGSNQITSFSCTQVTQAVSIPFVATTPTTTIQLEQTVGGGVVEFDNVSIQEPSMSLAPEIDLIDKPNVDDEEYAGKVQVLFDASTIHVFGEKDIIDDSGTYYQQAVYNNYGQKIIDVETAFRKFPKEVEDFQPSDTRVHGEDAAGEYIVTAMDQASIANEIIVHYSADGGDTYKRTTIATTATGQNNTLDYFDRCPAVSVDENGNVVVIYMDQAWKIAGAYGQIDGNGDLVLQDVTGLSADRFIHSSGISGYYPVMTRSPNGNIYVICRNGAGDAALIIAASDDNGATWDYGGAVVASTVKSVGSTLTARTNSPTQILALDDPTNPGNDVVLVFRTDSGGGDCNLAWTRNINDFNGNWEGGIAVFPHGGTVAEWLMGWDLTSDGNTLNLFACNGNDDQGYMNRIDLNLATIAVLDGTGVAVTSGNPISQSNGYTSTFTHGDAYKQQDKKLINTSDTSVLMSWAHASGDNGIKITKVYDTTNIAGSQVETIIEENSTGNEYDEVEMAKIGSEYFIFYKQYSNLIANALSEGKIFYRQLFDADPTSSDPVTMGTRKQLSTKDSVSGFVGRMRVLATTDYLHVVSERDNKLGFEGVFVNTRKERPANEEVEEFRQVPINITPSFSNDVTIYDFDRSGDYILAAMQHPTDDRLFLISSVDGGKSFQRAGDVTGNTTNQNNTTDYFTNCPAVNVNSDGTFTVLFLHADNGGHGISGQIEEGGIATITQNIGTDTGSRVFFVSGVNYNLRLASRGTKVVAYTTTSSNGGHIAVSTDSGATFAASIQVKDVLTNAGVQAGESSIIFVADNGSGGDRICIIGTDTGNPFELKMWYTDDDGATWGSETILQSLNAAFSDGLMGIGIDGNKVAIAAFNNSDDPNALNLITTLDIANGGAAPVFNAPVDISDGLGAIDRYSGYSSIQPNGFMHSLGRIKWNADNSLVVGFNRAGSGSHDVVVAKIEDTANVLTSLSHAVLEGTGSIIYQESGQMITGDSGEINVLTNETFSNRTNNTTSGKLRAIKIENASGAGDVSFGQIQDIGFKNIVSVGGFLGRIKVVGNTLMIEKEDGSSFEQLYFNSLQDRRVQKGS